MILIACHRHTNTLDKYIYLSTSIAIISKRPDYGPDAIRSGKWKSQIFEMINAYYHKVRYVKLSQWQIDTFEKLCILISFKRFDFTRLWHSQRACGDFY